MKHAFKNAGIVSAEERLRAIALEVARAVGPHADAFYGQFESRICHDAGLLMALIGDRMRELQRPWAVEAAEALRRQSRGQRDFGNHNVDASISAATESAPKGGADEGAILASATRTGTPPRLRPVSSLSAAGEAARAVLTEFDRRVCGIRIGDWTWGMVEDGATGEMIVNARLVKQLDHIRQRDHLPHGAQVQQTLDLDTMKAVMRAAENPDNEI